MTAPDGGPNNPPADPYGALAGHLSDLEEDVRRLRARLDEADVISTQANLETLRNAHIEMQEHLDEVFHAAGERGPDDTGGRIAQLEDAVKELNTAIERLLDDPAPAFPTLCWADLDQEAAAREWPNLEAWVRDVLLGRYRLEPQQLKPCWYRHPEALDEVSNLYVAWCRAYRMPSAPVERALEWHDRWLPHTLSRLAEKVQCNPEQHDDMWTRNSQPHVDDQQAFNEHVKADIGRRPQPEQNPMIS